MCLFRDGGPPGAAVVSIYGAEAERTQGSGRTHVEVMALDHDMQHCSATITRYPPGTQYRIEDNNGEPIAFSRLGSEGTVH